MKRLFFAMALGLVCLFSFGQSFDEVVYLKNGSVIKGTIVEQIPDVSLKVQTKDGNVFVYKMDEVEKTTKEISQNRTINQYGYDSYYAREKSPALACVLSFLVPGCGQYYNGQALKGTLMLVGYLGCLTTGIILSSNNSDYAYSSYWRHDGGSESKYKTGLALICVAGAIDIYSIIDAGVSAGNINRRNRSAGFALGNGTYLKASPAIITSTDLATNKMNLNPGLAVSLSF